MSESSLRAQLRALEDLTNAYEQALIQTPTSRLPCPTPLGTPALGPAAHPQDGPSPWAETILSALDELVLITDADACCVHVSQSAAERLGVEVGESLGELAMRYPMASAPGVRAFEGAHHPLQAAAVGAYFSDREGWLYDHERGSWWASVTHIPIEGRNGGGIVLLRDITGLMHRERTNMLEKLAMQTQLLLQHVSTTLDVGVLLWDVATDRLEDPSRTLTTMLEGWNVEEDWWQTIRARGVFPEPSVCAICQGLQHRGMTRVEAVDTNHMRRAYHLHFMGHAHHLAPHQSRELVIVDDVTVQRAHQIQMELLHRKLEKARDEAWEASQAKSQFLANMSHELRTPLNAIIGYTEMLLEEAGTPGVPAHFSGDLTRVRTAGKHLLELIGGVLDLSKIESGKLSLDVDAFSLTPFLAEIEETIEPMLQEDVFLHVEMPQESMTLYTDETKLRQCLLNLLSNAAKFTPDGLIIVRVESVEAEGVLRFEVEDTGPGVAPERQRAIFEAFEQESASVGRVFGGTGLGLTITHHFVAMMGGSLSLSSEPGEGATFWFEIPVTPFHTS